MSTQGRMPENVVAFRQAEMGPVKPDTSPKGEITNFRDHTTVTPSSIVEGLFPKNDDPIVTDLASFRQRMLDMALHRAENAA